MIIFNAIAFAILWRMLGGSFGNPKRWIALCYVGFFLLAQHTIGDAVLYGAIFYVLRILPTNALLSATHGQRPLRPDGRWNFLQIIAFKICRKIDRLNYDLGGKTYPKMVFNTGMYGWGMIYGFVRACLALPFIFLVGNYWMCLFLLQGVIYRLAGSAIIAEMVCGFLFGILL